MSRRFVGQRGRKYASVAASLQSPSRLIVDYEWNTNMYVTYAAGWAESLVFLDARRVLAVERGDSEHNLFPSGWTGSKRQIPAGFVLEPGWHKLEVRVKNRRATIKARPGYLAGS